MPSICLFKVSRWWAIKQVVWNCARSPGFVSWILIECTVVAVPLRQSKIRYVLLIVNVWISNFYPILVSWKVLYHPQLFARNPFKLNDPRNERSNSISFRPLQRDLTGPAGLLQVMQRWEAHVFSASNGWRCILQKSALQHYHYFMFLLFWMFAIMQHEHFSRTWCNIGSDFELRRAQATKTTTFLVNQQSSAPFFLGCAREQRNFPDHFLY